MKEQQGKLAFELHNKISDNELNRRELLMKNILLLRKMKDEELYKNYLGDDSSPWSGYLSEVSIYYTRARIQKWIYILENLVDKFSLKLVDLITIPESRLEDLARYFHQSKDVIKTEVEELLEDAKLLTPLDWRNTLAELKGKPTSETCKHENIDKLEVCQDCGHKHKFL